MSVQSLIPARPDPIDSFEHWLGQLLIHLAQHRQRRLLSCEGSQQWCDSHYDKIRQQFSESLLLSDRSERPEALAFAKSETLFGEESNLVAVDLFSGLNPDVLCLAAGLVKSPGLLVLLSPGMEHWHKVIDPYGIWQDGTSTQQSAFIDECFESIRQDRNACLQLQQQNETLPHISPTISTTPVRLIGGKTPEQTTLIHDLSHWLRSLKQATIKQRIALVTAARGRGKSTCLGFIVKKMTTDWGLSVYVTAPSRRAAATLLAQCDNTVFMAPDHLINAQLTADILVIDEAAGLPFSLLEQLYQRFRQVLMATTTSGYEGTGQGFLLRFIADLPKNQLTRFQLNQPVRWGSHDCLENWMDKTFLLKPTPTQSKLKSIYQLMVSAHYRTRPSDLRALMDNPDLIPITEQRANTIVGATLLNREGGFDLAHCRAIFLGLRRPKGHLLAQMLTAQAGLRDFAHYKGLRIQRIAVTEVHRRQGIGRHLLRRAEVYAKTHHYDYLGASFAFDHQSAIFWKNCGFKLAHIGYGRGKSSGRHSIAVIKILNPMLESSIVQLEEKRHSSLPGQLCQTLSHINTMDVVALLRYSAYHSKLTPLEMDEIEAFTQGNKGFELCFTTLQKAVMQSIAESADDQIIHPWLIEKIVQNHAWEKLSPNDNCVGRKSIQRKIRRLVNALLKKAT